MRKQLLSLLSGYQNKLVKQVEKSMKIRPQAKIDNFAFKNCNIIIDELI